MRKVRITVIHTDFRPQLADAYLTEGRSVGPCPLLKVGDTFLYEGGAQMPAGFCPWAWITAYRSVSVCSAGGTFTPWNKKDGQTIVCCTDAIRPVTFCIEAEGEDDEAVD